MKRFAIVSLAALLIGQWPTALRAEDAPPTTGDHAKMGEHMLELRLNHLTKKLDLTADQQVQVKQFLQADGEQMKQLHDQMMALHKQTDEKIQSVLTDAQKKKFAEMREHQKGEMKERMQERREKWAPKDGGSPKS